MSGGKHCKTSQAIPPFLFNILIEEDEEGVKGVEGDGNEEDGGDDEDDLYYDKNYINININYIKII